MLRNDGFLKEIETPTRYHSKRVAAPTLGLVMICAAALWCAPPLRADIQYSVTVLAAPDADHSFQTLGMSINESGVVAGVAGGMCSGSCIIPVVWTNGVPQTLPVPAGYTFNYIRDINNLGQVLGVLSDAHGVHVVIWTAGVPHILPQYQPAPDWANVPDSINESGHVLGGAGWWLWNGSSYVSLDYLAPATRYSFSSLTNDDHFLITSGTSAAQFPNYVANLGGIIRTLSLPTLPTECFGCSLGLVLTMNNNDQVYGQVQLGATYRQFFWDKDGTRAEVMSPRDGFGISTPFLNDAGQLLFTDYGGSAGHLIYVRQQNGTMEFGGQPNDIDTWIGRRGFNNSGQILVYGNVTQPGHTFAWVLTPIPVLTTTLSHTGNFTQGQNGATYSVTASNSAGAGPTSGVVTVTETVPTGLTLVSMAGTGWTCAAGGATCTRSDALNGGASYPAITVTVNVASNAATPLTNSVSVSGGGSAANSAGDSTAINANPAAVITSPVPGTILSATSVTFAWSAKVGADQYWLDVGTSAGIGDIKAAATTGTSLAVTGLPCDGHTIYVQLYTHGNSIWQVPQRYTYTAPTGCVTPLARIVSPVPLTTLPATSATFTWNAAAGADQYWLDVGSSAGNGGIWAAGTTSTSLAVTGLPCDGLTIYVQLYTHVNSTWQVPQRYTYTAPTGCVTPLARIVSPVPLSTLSATSATFTWSASAGADQYWLDVGSRAGNGDLKAAATTGTSLAVAGLPCDGRSLYVQLYTHVNGTWQVPQRYTYTALTGCAARIVSPVPLSTLLATSATFSWSAAAGADQYWLDVGSSPGNGGFSAAATTGTSLAVTGLPCDGRTLYVQLYTHVNNTWQFPQQYTYTALAGCTASIAQILSPTPLTTLSATSVTFAWKAVAGADQYWLDVGTSQGSGGISSGATTKTSRAVTGLPCDGRTLYVQLYTHVGSTWQTPQRYTYTAPLACVP